MWLSHYDGNEAYHLGDNTRLKVFRCHDGAGMDIPGGYLSIINGPVRDDVRYPTYEQAQRAFRKVMSALNAGMRLTVLPAPSSEED